MGFETITEILDPCHQKGIFGNFEEGLVSADEFRAWVLERSRPGCRPEDVDRCMNCDLLIVDDLGTEMTTSFVQSALYQIVNGRLMAGKQTIISTNLSPEEIGRRYSEQILSRIEGEYQVLLFFGEDIRRLTKERE